MKCAILLALVAFTSSTPLTGWGGVGYPSKGWWGYPTPQHDVAHVVSDQVTQGALHDQLAHTNQAINNLQWQLQQYPQHWSGYSHGLYGDVVSPYHSIVGPYGFGHQLAHEVVQHTEPIVAAQAIHHLQDDLHHQQYQFAGIGHPQGSVAHQLHDTVEVGVEADLTANDIHHQQIVQGVYVPPITGLHSGVFQARLQKLIDEHNEQEIENQIGHHHHWALQLHQQQLFVNQQIQQIETQYALVQHQGHPEQVHQLKQAIHHLHLQEYHLIQEQLAHHLAILQLQQALIHKEEQVLQDTVNEHIHEQAVHGLVRPQPYWNKYWSL